MPLNPDDPRVIKTRRGFQEAFLRLLVEHGYDAITIKDIAEEALSSRVSFYRHYRDKDDLLIHCLNDLYEKLASQTEVFSPERMEKEGYVPLLRFYEHIEKHEALYEILLTGHGTHIVLNRLREHFARRAIAQINWYCSPEELAAPVEILAYHMSSTQIAMAVWWLEHGKPYPADYMARISVWISLAGVAGTVGRTKHPVAPPPYPGRNTPPEG